MAGVCLRPIQQTEYKVYHFDCKAKEVKCTVSKPRDVILSNNLSSYRHRNKV